MRTTSPIRNVLEVSPWKSFRNTAISTFTMSPSRSGRLLAVIEHHHLIASLQVCSLVRNTETNDVVHVRGARLWESIVFHKTGIRPMRDNHLVNELVDVVRRAKCLRRHPSCELNNFVRPARRQRHAPFRQSAPPSRSTPSQQASQLPSLTSHPDFPARSAAPSLRSPCNT